MPFAAAALHALTAFIDNHISVIFFTITTFTVLTTIEYFNPGYLTLSEMLPNGPPFLTGPPLPMDSFNRTNEIVNGTCHVITVISDLVVYESPPTAASFWVSFLQKFSFENVHEVTWDIVRIYDLSWNSIPEDLAPFVCLTIYLAATWQLWCMGVFVAQFSFRQLRRILHKSTPEEDEPTPSPHETPLPPSPPDSPSKAITDGSTAQTASKLAMNVALTFWRLLARTWRKLYNDAERDLKNARIRNVHFSQEMNVSQYQGRIAKLEQELAEARKSTFTQQAAADELRKAKFDLQSRTNDLRSARKDLDLSKAKLRSETTKSGSLEISLAEATALAKEQDDTLQAQVYLLKSFKAQLDQVPEAQTLGLSSILSESIEPQVAFQGKKLQDIVAPDQLAAQPKSNVSETDSIASDKATDPSTPENASSVQKSEGEKSQPQGAEQQEKVARNVVVAAEKYNTAFPHGFERIWASPKNWHCGLDAAIKTMEAMYPDRPRPTMDDLTAIIQQSEWWNQFGHIEDAGVSIQEYFTPDVLDMIIRRWAQTNGFRYRIGYIQPTENGYLPSLCIGEEDDDYSEDIIWVYINYEIIEDFETGHYEGVKPIGEKLQRSKEAIDIESADPTPKDFESVDENVSPRTSTASGEVGVESKKRASGGLQDTIGAEDGVGTVKGQSAKIRAVFKSLSRAKVPPALPKLQSKNVATTSVTLPVIPSPTSSTPQTAQCQDPQGQNASKKALEGSGAEHESGGTKRELPQTVDTSPPPRIPTKGARPLSLPEIATKDITMNRSENDRLSTKSPTSLRESKWAIQKGDDDFIDKSPSGTAEQATTSSTVAVKQISNELQKVNVVGTPTVTVPFTNAKTSASPSSPSDDKPLFAKRMVDVDARFKPYSSQKARFEQWNRLQLSRWRKDHSAVPKDRLPKPPKFTELVA